ncbi:NADH dehydrogenase transmembrane subunit [Synechococcus sp. PCC 7502]|uniref:NAD(P)H-quinone oxidoreductase subunit L n=1 Tax=Synechococcus sp. PCC 7502 TaxID=1173263 RepID=UPI00029FF3A6|nr:NAD(P)H-quinone oxidoreductase subunit L [Synechococcus sp. PCC 7502]AFY73369.1 NADH dehydrogenase transmembrane subunit [Synechococcus sp. PCC 7502]
MEIITSLLESGFLVYGAIAGAYLVVIPFILLYYFKARWYLTGSWERVFICFTVFFFFPGLLLLSPLVNFRPELRKLG